MHGLLRPADDGSRGWCGPQPVGRGLGPLTRQERPKPRVWGAVEGSEAPRPPAPLTTEGDSLPSLARGWVFWLRRHDLGGLLLITWMQDCVRQPALLRDAMNASTIASTSAELSTLGVHCG